MSQNTGAWPHTQVLSDQFTTSTLRPEGVQAPDVTATCTLFEEEQRFHCRPPDIPKNGRRERSCFSYLFSTYTPSKQTADVTSVLHLQQNAKVSELESDVTECQTVL